MKPNSWDPLLEIRELKEESKKKQQFAVLWRWLLSSVRARYLFKEDLMNSLGEWTTEGDGIQYLRESTVLEVIYSNLKSGMVS